MKEASNKKVLQKRNPSENKKIDTCVWIEFGKIATTLAHRAWGRCCSVVGVGEERVDIKQSIDLEAEGNEYEWISEK